MPEMKMAGGRSMTKYERSVGIYFMDCFSRVINFDFETDSGHHIDAKVKFCNYDTLDTLMKDVQEQINTRIRWKASQCDISVLFYQWKPDKALTH